MDLTIKSHPLKTFAQAGLLVFVLLSAMTGCGGGDSGSETAANQENNSNTDTGQNNDEGNGNGNTETDTDLDTIADNIDNCINDPNPDQSDINNDNIGDACDPYYQAQLLIVLDE